MYSAQLINQQRHDTPALVFYTVSPSPEEPFVNRAAAWCTGKYGMSHVELRFRTGESLSVYSGETVFLRRRGYSNSQYKIMPLNGVSIEGEREMMTFARQQVGKAFNRSGMWRAWLPGICNRRTDGHLAHGQWFCSELVSATLQRAGYLRGVDTCQCSPNQLYALANAGHRASSEYGHVGRPLSTSLGMNRIALQSNYRSLDLSCFGDVGVRPYTGTPGAQPVQNQQRAGSAVIQLNGVAMMPL